MYDTIWWSLLASLVRYESGFFFRDVLYDINLEAPHTTILSTRGVPIPIYLVSSATNSFSDV